MISPTYVPNRSSVAVLSLCGMLIAAAAAQPRSWQITPLESPRTFSWMTDRSLCLDAQGHPHVAFGQDHLYHGWSDGAEWVVETVDPSPGVGAHASIAAGADGSLHIAYFDDLNQNLRYARYEGAVWQIEVVGTGGKFTSIVLDAQGRPHLAYQEEDLNYAWKNDEGWQIEVIDVQYAPGGFSSLALDGAGRPHISHYEMINDDMLYSFRDDAGWHTETLADQGDVGWHSSLAIDGQGRPHVSYYDRFQYSVVYACKDETGWQFDSLERGGDWTSLALDAQGRPHLGFCTTTGPMHAYHDGAAWVEDQLPGTADYASLAIDASGRLFLSYFVDEPFGGLRELRVSTKTEGVWETATVSTAGDVGTYSDLALGPDGYLHACYVNSAGGAIHYARQTADGWTVQELVQTGIDLSLALDPQGRPHISFYDDDADAVCQVSHDGAGWMMETVQQDVWTGGGYTSLAVADDGVLRMTYRVNRELMYAERADTGWIVETVTPDQGFYTSLRLDASGAPHIAHHSWADRMRYTCRDASGWHSEIADDYGEGGMYCALALDAAGYPHITYFDNFPDDIRYAYRDVGGWHVETVDTQNDVGKYTSLAFDPQGRPCVTYLYGQAVDLRFAYREGGVWQRSTVTSEGRVGEWSKLAVDETGRPHVIYYDETRGDVMYAVADAVGGDFREGARLGLEAVRITRVRPNPASARIIVSIALDPAETATSRPVRMRLFDLAGRLIHDQVGVAVAGSLDIPAVLGIPPGTHVLRVTLEDTGEHDETVVTILPGAGPAR